MKTQSRLGIWMDHSNAYLMEYIFENGEEKTNSLEVVHADVSHDSSKGENQMHNKEQHLQAEYYKKLGIAIKNYEEVILFGPTDAKAELLNILKADHQFEKVKIEAQSADKMTENQQHAFVKEYFSKN